MNIGHAYRVVKALADVPRPATTADRAQVCEAIDAIQAGR